MVIDSSALIAILREEEEEGRLLKAIEGARVRRMSAASYVETAIIVDSRFRPEAAALFDSFLAETEITLEPVTAAQARLARQAYAKFGKGRHPAGLNFGDCFAYALAKATGEPLLYKGNDFAQTDIDAAPW